MNIEAKCKVLEELFLDDQFEAVSNFWDKNAVSLNFSSNDRSDEIAEILSTSFVETGQYSKALIFINSYLDFRLKNSKVNEEWFVDDVTSFIYLKIAVYDQTGRIFKEYKAVNKYLQFKQNESIFEIRDDLENIFYNKYVFLNGILMFIGCGFQMLSSLNVSLFNNVIFLISSLILIGWFILNSLFKTRSRFLLIKLIKYITLPSKASL